MRRIKVGRHQRLKRCLGKLSQLIGLCGIWSDLLLAEFACRGAECLMLLARPVQIDNVTHGFIVLLTRDNGPTARVLADPNPLGVAAACRPSWQPRQRPATRLTP